MQILPPMLKVAGKGWDRLKNSKEIEKRLEETERDFDEFLREHFPKEYLALQKQTEEELKIEAKGSTNFIYSLLNAKPSVSKAKVPDPEPVVTKSEPAAPAPNPEPVPNHSNAPSTRFKM